MTPYSELPDQTSGEAEQDAARAKLVTKQLGVEPRKLVGHYTWLVRGKMDMADAMRAQGMTVTQREDGVQVMMPRTYTYFRWTDIAPYLYAALGLAFVINAVAAVVGLKFT